MIVYEYLQFLIFLNMYLKVSHPDSLTHLDTHYTPTSKPSYLNMLGTIH